MTEHLPISETEEGKSQLSGQVHTESFDLVLRWWDNENRLKLAVDFIESPAYRVVLSIPYVFL